MDLGGVRTTINASPVISPENYVTFPLPCFGFKILLPVIIAASFPFCFKSPVVTYQYYQYDNYED